MTTKLFGKDLSIQITFVGLAGAGKTTLVKRLKSGDQPLNTQYFPTMGVNIETIKTDDFELIAADLGGQKTYPASLWEPFVKKSHAIVFVFDSADKSKVEEAAKWLKRVIEWTHEDSAFLFLANKKDLPNAMPLNKIIDLLELSTVMDQRPRSFAVHMVSALYGDGVHEAWEWLLNYIKNKAQNQE